LPPPAVANRHSPLGRAVPDNVAIKFFDDFAWGQFLHGLKPTNQLKMSRFMSGMRTKLPMSHFVSTQFSFSNAADDSAGQCLNIEVYSAPIAHCSK
jgi:hypothetical protein